MNELKKRRIEFGDFQTPDTLALDVCRRLAALGFSPDVVVEPTCGVGGFVLAAAQTFPSAHILGFEINEAYLEILRTRIQSISNPERFIVELADFFTTDWQSKLSQAKGSLLVLGNPPWVTNATQGALGSSNLPEKSNFQGHSGFDAISGKANFDISEWMLLEILRWFQGRSGDVAMLVKTGVARKILAHAERLRVGVSEAFIIGIDAKKSFNASVEACLLVIRLNDDKKATNYDYAVFKSLHDTQCRRVGHRDGHTVADLALFEQYSYLIGKSPQKWRSGVKHDASAVMEFTRTKHGFTNGLEEEVELESTYLFPLLKGSDIGSAKEWRSKYVLVTQQFVGEPTAPIQNQAPKTWSYLEKHAAQLDRRGSTIYVKNPRFSVFGVGDYAFRPWRIAICALYKGLRFRLIGPIEGKPVMFDDTVYYLSFDTEQEARAVLEKLLSEPVQGILSALIFWDEKRPIKTAVLNLIDWTRLEAQTDELAAFQDLPLFSLIA